MNKSMILAALTGAAIVLAGCESSTEPTPRETVYVEQESPSTSSSSVEDEFLSDVAEHMTPALHDEPQADVVELGHSICGAFDRGAHIDDVVSVGMESGLTYTDTIVIAASAVVNFCPEHRDNGSISNMT